MARCSLRFIHFLGLMMYISSATSSSPSATIFTLEEKLHTLTDNFIKFKEDVEDKHMQLEAKNAKLEANDQIHKDVRRVLENKVTQLEARVIQLEATVEHQESLLIALQTEQSLTTTSGSRNIPSAGKSSIARTCRDLRATDPSLPSGMYWIDPDGQGIGDDAIYVQCNMTSGSTSVPHDSESPIDVGHCADPGCYSRAINYVASSRQIKALSQLSAECQQSIKYECNYAPFETNNIVYSWWNDKDGNPQYFWSGSNSSVHTCQCGIDHNCVEDYVKCNCDSTVPLLLADNGVIRDKEILPISRLNFGRTQLATSSGVHTLGQFECNGQVSVAGIPTSCEDLWLVGHTLSGLYSVMGTSKMESVYCDFTKLPDDAGFQKWIGYADIKSALTYFHVSRNAHFSQIGTPIPFQISHINTENAMDLNMGKFRAPRTGTYFFSFNGMVEIPASPRVGLGVSIYLNGVNKGRSWNEKINGGSSDNDQVGLQVTLNLKTGDQVWVEIDDRFSETFLWEDGSGLNTHFTGWILEEEIKNSL
ncbi:uncharacterized protein LOC124336186 [Daphnia pulicaria]|uniref:uncharacterized protein LOC124336186 n=1 Tax=Daphnia pulicaria TaxID=35523 RepID=UPI001EEA6D16|nr:uncharacterized protein LOC124336186 [Daphnia pulicaria]